MGKVGYMDAATASRAPEGELEAVAAADAVEEGSATSQDDAMQAELENIAFEATMLFDLANKLTGRGSRRVKRIILAATDSIWDSANRLYSEGNYDKSPGSASARKRLAIGTGPRGCGSSGAGSESPEGSPLR